MLSETRVSSRNQTVVPSRIRRIYDVGPGDVLEWEEAGETIIVKVRRRVGLKDIRGIVSEGGDAVGDKRKVQRGRS